eukprot:m51a1_g11701 hypothetical protein (299) ;mRNA; r:38783-39901
MSEPDVVVPHITVSVDPTRCCSGSPSPDASAMMDEIDLNTGSSSARPKTPAVAPSRTYPGSLARAPENSVDAPNCYAELDATAVLVRGAEYLSDRKKYPSKPALCTLAAADLFTGKSKVDGAVLREDNDTMRTVGADGECEMLVVSFQLPGPMLFSIYYVLPTETTAENATGLALLRKFMSESQTDEWRCSRFKLIPKVLKGPWMLTKAVPNIPAVLGRKLATRFFRKGKAFEVEFDVTSSKVANWIWSTARSCLKSITIELGFVIEGHEGELPEHLLGGVRLQSIDLESGHAKSLAK